MGKVELPKIGILKFRKSCEVAGEIRSCTISKEPHGEFSISFLCRVEIPEPTCPNGEIGIDLGIVHILAFSNGRQYSDLPTKRIKRIEQRIAMLQRQIVKKVKYSSNWRKKKLKISKCHSHIY